MTKAHPGKKAIVWAQNAHIFNGQPTKAAGAELPAPNDDIDSKGPLVARRWKSKVYSLGVFAGGGSLSWMGGTPIEFAPKTKESLEDKLEQAGGKLAFIDFLGLSVQHPLRQPILGWMNRHNAEPITTRWPNGFEGVFYVARMEPRVSR